MEQEVKTETKKAGKKKSEKAKNNNLLFGCIPLPRNIDINLELSDGNKVHFELGKNKKTD